MKDIVENKWWEFQFLPQIPQTADSRISSLQAKFVKFLQFNPLDMGISEDKAILYFDHKIEILKNHIETIKSLCTTPALVCNTPKIKTLIDHEIEAASKQERYRSQMP